MANHEAERLGQLERQFGRFEERLDHLDECLDEFKEQMMHPKTGHITVIKQRLDGYDKRWWIGVGIICGMIFLSTNGPVSLKTLLELLRAG